MGAGCGGLLCCVAALLWEVKMTLFVFFVRFWGDVAKIVMFPSPGYLFTCGLSSPPLEITSRSLLGFVCSVLSHLRSFLDLNVSRIEPSRPDLSPDVSCNRSPWPFRSFFPLNWFCLLSSRFLGWRLCPSWSSRCVVCRRVKCLECPAQIRAAFCCVGVGFLGEGLVFPPCLDCFLSR